MKNFHLLFLVFFYVISNAQQSFDINLEWNLQNYTTTNQEFLLPMFEVKSFYFDEGIGQVFYQNLIKSKLRMDENSVTIGRFQTEIVTSTDLGSIKVSEIPQKFTYQVSNVTERDQISHWVQFNPFYKENNQIYRVKNISFNYALESSIQNKPTLLNFQGISNSVLRTGEWYRFFVEKSGVYRINRSFLQSLGMNVNVDPRRIQLFGHGGKMLPLSNAVNFPTDPQEMSIRIIGEEDGSFDSSDYILVYLEGHDQWSQENFTHLNYYSDKAYYYITVGSLPGKRIQNYQEPTATATFTTNTFDDYHFHERDLVNIGRLGRRWFGEQFGIQNNYSFTFNIPNIDTSEPIQAQVRMASAATSSTSLAIRANGTEVANATLVGTGTVSPPYYVDTPINFTINAQSNIELQLSFTNNGVPNARVFLDFITLRAKRLLTGGNQQYHIQSQQLDSGNGVVQMNFQNTQNLIAVWDISDIYNVSAISINGNNSFGFKAAQGQGKRFIAVHQSDFLTPQRESNARVTNQNLKGTIFQNNGQFQDVDYLIITPRNLRSEAQRLANFHQNSNQLVVRVVDLESIYQEFSSGRQDIAAIRNFVRYVYWNASTPSNRVKYLNLFGDASFDFKIRVPASINTNIVPIYHAINGNTTGISSFMSDDFYGYMDANEGNLDQFFPNGIDIAVGRMLVSNTIQAKEMVDKVIDYHDEKSYGRWRNNLVVVSDDTDKPSDATLQLRMNQAADVIVAEKPFFNMTKIFLDAYQQETSAGGQRYPKAREDFKNAFENGTLVINYLGHGGEEGLAAERVYEKSDGQNFSNKFRYPLFITLTCEFSRFDNPYRPTAGEYTYWNPNGGAIAMITTTREIGQITAENANFVLNEYLFGYGASNEVVSMAEALRRTKNSFGNSSLRVISFIGCPATKLAIPKPKIIITKVNDEPLAQSNTILNALSSVKLSGEVRDESGNQLLSNYNGQLAVQVFDKNRTATTLNNDFLSPPINFNILGETIFRGNATVNNGVFEFSFVVPRDIRVNVGNGRVSLYAKTSNPTLQNQTGYELGIQVGGVNAIAPVDNIAPTARLYMNDETFINGGITNNSPIFLAIMEDDSGMNTAGGIGHDMVAILDGDESNPIIMNDFYEADADNFTKGSVRFPFRNLEKGLHHIKFTAWDTHNNPVTSELNFFVAGEDQITLSNVLNYPNPFVNYTQFWFSHDRPFEPLDVQVQIFTVTGKVVKTINQTVITEGFLSREITWDGRDDFGDKIGKGVYIYRLKVKSTLTNKISEKVEKLVIL
jgi:hypothetical protein